MYYVSQSSPFEGTHEALIIGMFEGNKPLQEPLAELDKRMNGHLSTLKKEKQLRTKLGTVTEIFSLGLLKSRALYAVGLGKKEELTEEKLRQSLAAAGKKIREHRITNGAVLLDSFVTEKILAEQVGFLVAEAIALSLYQLADYKEKTNEVEKELQSFTVYSKSTQLSDALKRGKVYGEGTNLARGLVNTPGNMLTPSDLADEARKLAVRHGFKVEVLERAEMEKLGMGALLAVASGSDQPPKMIVLTYEGAKEQKDVLGFVGKGLTFDSGGISIKPSQSMHEMKYDMGGAAAVLGAMEIIGTLKPEVNILAVIPSTENMINGSALKPGDVIRSLAGKTIEVRNTDAEGRLILADAVTYAKQLGATYLIDVATLTGAVMVALGDCTTGAVTNNEEWMEEVLEASAETGEWTWRLPSYEPYREMLKTSDIADLNNAPGRLAGSITAGLFVGEFAEDTPWVHLDIAGTAWQSKATNLGPIGGTGVMARTLARVAENYKRF
ncbi:leucyl aminopeptidase [Halalkalibacterium ligniniphilum]|uniref:leucyl aminopeptidase n=1 Tax=Halalkalibacterium ligniniphilum TaxID=1134413 RepID=UPI0003459AF3|nr:leucyl aminopeptidase [Halalkalibacterium ligniniphilum]